MGECSEMTPDPSDQTRAQDRSAQGSGLTARDGHGRTHVMVRRRLMLIELVLIGVLAALALPTDGSALLIQTTVTLTATGPVPSNVKMSAGQSVLVFVNDDSVSHRVVFTDGRCSLDVAPGSAPETIQTGVNACPFPMYVGSYAYTEDGKFPGSVRLLAAPRSVTLTAPTHKIRRGAPLMLHGALTFAQAGEPVPKPPFPVIVLARHGRQHAFHRIRMLAASLQGGQFVWQLRVHPRTRTTYIARVKGEPRIWKQARSRPFTIRIRR